MSALFRRYATWRHRVWAGRVYKHRARLQAAINDGDRTSERAAEAAVTRALVRAQEWQVRL